MKGPLELAFWRLTEPRAESAKLLIQYENRFLLITKTYGIKYWTLPGGRKKRNETPEETAWRRVRRDLTVAPAELVSIGNYFHTRQYKKDVVCAFHAQVNSPEYKIDTKNVDKAGWFTLEEIKSLNRSESVDDVLDLYSKHQNI